MKDGKKMNNQCFLKEKKISKQSTLKKNLF